MEGDAGFFVAFAQGRGQQVFGDVLGAPREVDGLGAGGLPDEGDFAGGWVDGDAAAAEGEGVGGEEVWRGDGGFLGLGGGLGCHFGDVEMVLMARNRGSIEVCGQCLLLDSLQPMELLKLYIIARSFVCFVEKGL